MSHVWPPLRAFDPGHKAGLGLSRIDASTVQVAPGSARASNNLANVTLDAALNVTFADLDVGVEAAGPYDVWLYDDGTAKLVISGDTVASPPTANGVKIDSFFNSAALVIEPFHPTDPTARPTWFSAAVAMVPLSGGNQAALTAVDLTALLPASATIAIFQTAYTNAGGAAGDTFVLTPTAAGINPVFSPGFGLGAGPQDRDMVMCGIVDRKIYYKVANVADSLTLVVVGYF